MNTFSTMFSTMHFLFLQFLGDIFNRFFGLGYSDLGVTQDNPQKIHMYRRLFCPALFLLMVSFAQILPNESVYMTLSSSLPNCYKYKSKMKPICVTHLNLFTTLLETPPVCGFTYFANLIKI
jgi:hypothetical protein